MATLPQEPRTVEEVHVGETLEAEFEQAACLFETSVPCLVQPPKRALSGAPAKPATTPDQGDGLRSIAPGGSFLLLFAPEMGTSHKNSFVRRRKTE